MHLEDADLARRAEAVLQRAQRPVGPLALALEGQHAVDQVLEHPRSRDRALLGHVPDQDHRHAALLREPHQPARHLAHLPDRARAARHRRVVEHLHRVDDADVGALGVDRREHRVEVGLGHDRHLQRRRRRGAAARSLTWAADSSPDTYRTLRPAAARLPSAALVSVDLPMPGEPPMRTSEPGTTPPPSTRSSSPMPVPSRSIRAASTSPSATGVSARPERAPPSAPPPAARAAPRRAAPRRACSTRRSPGSAHATSGSRARTRSRRRRWRIEPCCEAKRAQDGFAPGGGGRPRIRHARRG